MNHSRNHVLQRLTIDSMEVAKHPGASPYPFPNLNLTVPYTDALRYAQGRLKMLGSGGLKAFCETHHLTYTNIINLKNGKLKREEPRLVQRLLTSLAVSTELLHYPVGTKTPCFLLPNAQALTTFQGQLEFLTATE